MINVGRVVFEIGPLVTELCKPDMCCFISKLILFIYKFVKTEVLIFYIK